MKAWILVAWSSTLLLCTTPSLAAEGPSYDCAKASGEIETLICQNAGLAALDRKLATTYKQAVAVQKKTADAAAGTKTLQATQRGWVKGRNDCWKETDKTKCVKDSYQRRITELQVQYSLVPAGKPVFYFCENNPANEIVATFFQSELPGARLERGDKTVVAILGPTGSGARYEAPFGVIFWIKGDAAMVDWPQGTHFNCQVRK